MRSSSHVGVLLDTSCHLLAFLWLTSFLIIMLWHVPTTETSSSDDESPVRPPSVLLWAVHESESESEIELAIVPAAAVAAPAPAETPLPLAQANGVKMDRATT